MDTCSLSSLNEFTTQHLDWYVTVDFDTQTLTCEVRQKYERVRRNEDNSITLDTKDLKVSNTLSDKFSADKIFGTKLKFRQFCPAKFFTGLLFPHTIHKKNMI